MSRTKPDLHLRNPQNPRGVRKQQLQREARFCEDNQGVKVNRSGEVFVTQGENNRLNFKATRYQGARSSQNSCGFQPLKDGTRVYLHLCWHFFNSDLHSKETKELLIALDRVVRILKELDCYHVQQSSEDLDSERDGDGSVANFDSILSVGGTNLAIQSTKKAARRCTDALVDNGYLRTPETGESTRQHDSSPCVVNGKRKLQLQIVEYEPPALDVYEGEKITGEGQCTIGSGRKKKKCQAESDIEIDSSNSEDVRKASHTLPLQQRLRDFLREREVKKKARDSILASARKVVHESTFKYGECKSSEQVAKTGRGLGKVHVAVEGRGKTGVERQKANSRSSVGQLRLKPSTELPSKDLIRCISDSDVEIVSRTSHDKAVEQGGSATKGNNVISVRRKASRGGEVDLLLKIGSYAIGKSKGRKGVSNQRNKKASKRSPKKLHIFDHSVPKVDEVLTNWKLLDERQQVRLILNQFHYLEEYYRAKYPNGVESGDLDGKLLRVRPDLKAGQYLQSRGFCLNQGFSVVGAIPGVCIGQCFRYREELILLAIHRAQQAGIDYISANKSEYTDDNGNRVSVAVSIVASGGYNNNQDDGNTTLIYSGHGGYSNKRTGCKKRSELSQTHDQELVRGNLALVNSCNLQVPVRVTKGIQALDQGKKLYFYDGLYDITDCYEEIGASGFKIWKFKLVKQSGQPVTIVSKYLSKEGDVGALTEGNAMVEADV